MHRYILAIPCIHVNTHAEVQLKACTYVFLSFYQKQGQSRILFFLSSSQGKGVGEGSGKEQAKLQLFPKDCPLARMA